MFARGKMCPMANVKSDRSMFCYNKGESTLYTTQKILNTSGMESVFWGYFVLSNKHKESHCFTE